LKTETLRKFEANLMPFFTEGRMMKKLERKEMENVSDRHYTFNP